VPPDFGAAAGLAPGVAATAPDTDTGVEAAGAAGAQAAIAPAPAEDSSRPSAVRRVSGPSVFTSRRPNVYDVLHVLLPGCATPPDRIRDLLGIQRQVSSRSSTAS
jgi:hypothetical protein